MNPKTKKTIKIVVDVLLWIFLAFSLLMTILAFTAQASSAGFPKLGSSCLLTVQSDSMAEPGGFYKGDLIIGKTMTDEQKQNLKVGDVVTYYMDLTPSDGIDNKELNTHRIVRVDKDAAGRVIYYTKGDHNSLEDGEPIRWNAVEAIWTGTRIAGIGAVIGFLQSPTGFLICVVIPLLLFFLYELYVLIFTVIQIRNKGKRQITAADEELIKQRAIEEYLRQQAEAAAKANENPQSEEKA